MVPTLSAPWRLGTESRVCEAPNETPQADGAGRKPAERRGGATPSLSVRIDSVAPEATISTGEAAELAGVSPSTLQRWVASKIIPLRDGRWTRSAAAQARVVVRLRERGHSLEELRRAVREGRLAFGYVEDLLPEPGAHARAR